MNILDKITEENVITKYESNSLKRNYAVLRKKLTPQERKILLGIIDKKNLFIEDAAYKNYQNGFRDGVKLASEIFKK